MDRLIRDAEIDFQCAFMEAFPIGSPICYRNSNGKVGVRTFAEVHSYRQGRTLVVQTKDSAKRKAISMDSVLEAYRDGG